MRAIFVEGDSLIALTKIIRSSTPAWAYHNLILSIMELISKFQQFYYRHTYREGNSVVDALAVLETSEHEDEKIWLSSWPPFITRLCQEDLTHSTPHK